MEGPITAAADEMVCSGCWCMTVLPPACKWLMLLPLVLAVGKKVIYIFSCLVAEKLLTLD